MTTIRSELPVPVAYLLIVVCQGPLWLCGGLLWAALMVAFAGFHPVNGIIGGILWALAMWAVVGNLLACGFVWRRSATFTVRDRGVFRAALAQACQKLRFVVLSESADEVVLGPKRALLRFRLQEVRVTFDDATATLTGPAISFGAVRKQVEKALAGV